MITPGQWKVADDSFSGLIVAREEWGTRCPDGALYLPVPICRLGIGHNRPQDEAEANARLIAASPDLLDVCVRLLIAIGHPEAIDAIISQYVRGAVAKAKGGDSDPTG